MKSTQCLLFLMMPLSLFSQPSSSVRQDTSRAIAVDEGGERMVRINVIRFLQGKVSYRVVDADSITTRMRSALQTMGLSCRVDFRTVAQGELTDRYYSGAVAGEPIGKSGYDALSVCGWVEEFDRRDFVRVRMIASLETRSGNAHTFFYEADIRGDRIVRWNGVDRNLDERSLDIPITALAAALCDSLRTAKEFLKRSVVRDSQENIPFSIDNEIEYSRRNESRPPETSLTMKLLLNDPGAEHIVVPIPPLWYRDLQEYLTRLADSSFSAPAVPKSGTDWRVAAAGGAVGFAGMVGLSQLFQGNGEVFMLTDRPDSSSGNKGKYPLLATTPGLAQTLVMIGNVAAAILWSHHVQIGLGYLHSQLTVPEHFAVGSIVQRTYALRKTEALSLPTLELRYQISDRLSIRMSDTFYSQEYAQSSEVLSTSGVLRDTSEFSISVMPLTNTVNYTYPISESSFRINAGVGFEAVYVMSSNNHPIDISTSSNEKKFLETSIDNLKFSAVLNLGGEYVIANRLSLCADVGLRIPERYTFRDGFWARRGIARWGISLLYELRTGITRP